MPYMMSFERAAEARGREEGREEGLIEGIRSAIKLGLELKFGHRGLEVAPKLMENATDIETLEQLKADLRSELSLVELGAKYTTESSL